MRYEKKYQITHLTKNVVEQVLRLHPAGFQKIFPDRQVNNIYFDSPDLQTCQHNLDGVNQRKKYRLRWYGKDLKNIKNPRFEIKIKHNELGTKSVQTFPNSSLNEVAKITAKVNDLHKFIALSPTLLNTYQRSYFGTSNKKFRITIDWDLHFYPPSHKTTFQQQPFIEKGIILEVKYEAEDDALAQDIFKFLPFRQTKSSKYIRGILLNVL